MQIPFIHLQGKTDPLSKYLAVKDLFTEASNLIAIEFDCGNCIPSDLDNPIFQGLKHFIILILVITSNKLYHYFYSSH